MFEIKPRSKASPAIVERKLFVALKVISTEDHSPHRATR
jgi:hypothetical protein